MECLKQITERQGQCFKLSLLCMLNEPGAECFSLVHGRVGSIAHAWVNLNDGRIYDVVLDSYFWTAEYMRNATVEVAYDHKQGKRCSVPILQRSI
jgi:hypothetical protein